jgi:hypothetical protein
LFPILLSLSPNPINCPIVHFSVILFHCSGPSLYFRPFCPPSVVKSFFTNREYKINIDEMRYSRVVRGYDC